MVLGEGELEIATHPGALHLQDRPQKQRLAETGATRKPERHPHQRATRLWEPTEDRGVEGSARWRLAAFERNPDRLRLAHSYSAGGFSPSQ